jgi:hypothetical protein
MNWQKGFFRAWVLLTIIWLAGAGTFAYGPTHAYFDADRKITNLELTQKNKEPNPFDQFDKPKPSKKHLTDTEVFGTPPAEKPLDFSKFGTLDEQAEYVDRRTALRKLKIIAIIAMAGPAALLALGAMIVWVFSGFRKEQA